jgi:hypothetical protein
MHAARVAIRLACPSCPLLRDKIRRESGAQKYTPFGVPVTAYAVTVPPDVRSRIVDKGASTYSAIDTRVAPLERSERINETEMSDEEKDNEFAELLKKGPRYSASKDYVHFNEVEDVLSSTDLMALVAPLIGKKPSYWKWMIVATHNALQGAMVCALADTTGTAVLGNKSGARMLAWLETREGDRGKPPEERLAEFGILLERCVTSGRIIVR